MAPKIAIIGAGLAGLYCGKILLQHGYDVEVFEKSDRIGGRMKTDELDGYLLDHGFHVLQTGYSFSSKIINYDELDVKSFEPGALVIRSSTSQSKVWRLSDPFRRPIKAIIDSMGFFASPFDMLRVLRMRRKIRKIPIDCLFDNGRLTTEQWLREQNFSQRFIDRFFYPLFSGIFLESELRTSERMFKFVFRSMSDGDMVIPKNGIQAVPNLIARSIPREKINLNSDVEIHSNQSFALGDEVRDVDAVVVAYDHRDKKSNKHVWTLYFSADKSPLNSEHIMLNSEVRTHNKLISYIAVPSDVQANYAPIGKSLVSVTVLGERADSLQLRSEGVLQAAVKSELEQWFGTQTSSWKCISVQNIRNALPETDSELFDEVIENEFEFQCGDFMTHGSVEGTLLSAQKTAQQLMSKFPITK